MKTVLLCLALAGCGGVSDGQVYLPCDRAGAVTCVLGERWTCGDKQGLSYLVWWACEESAKCLCVD